MTDDVARVQRWTIGFSMFDDESDPPRMVHSERGGYVLASDHDAIVAEKNAEIERLTDLWLDAEVGRDKAPAAARDAVLDEVETALAELPIYGYHSADEFRRTARQALAALRRPEPAGGEGT